MRILFSTLVLSIFLISCGKTFTYNPNEINIEEKDKNQNTKNLERLQSKAQKDSFSFVVIGDTQRFYDEMDDFVEKVKSYPDISFVVLNGDITDFGLKTEYLWISNRLQKLSFPYFVVIGNHDMLGNGRELYKQMYGPENFGFSFSNHKFIVLNSNSHEVGKNGTLPDTSWLKQELSVTPSQQKIFILSHMAPFSSDFDESVQDSFVKILTKNGNVIYSIHAHDDNSYLGQWYGPPVNYMVVNGIHERSFVLIKVSPNDTEIEKISF